MVIDEEYITLIRKNIINSRFIADLPDISGGYKGVYNHYILQNPKCFHFENNTKSILINTQRFDHPLYQRILAASNSQYSFLKGEPRHINFITFDPVGNYRNWIESIDVTKSFVLYAEEMGPVFPYKDIEYKDKLRKKIDSKNFLGFASHINETRKCASKCFDCISYFLPLPAKPFATPAIVSRPILEEEILLVYSGSWRCGYYQKYARGFHVADEVFVLAKKYCKNLKICFIENHLSPGELLSKAIYPNDVTIINDIGFFGMACVMLSCDIYLLPSYHMHANSLLEAMQCGLACVVCDEFGINEIVQDNGIKIKPFCETSKIVPNYGRVSPEEEYKTLYNCEHPSTKKYIDKIVESIIFLYQDRERLVELRKNSVGGVEKRFSIKEHNETFNFMLKKQNNSFIL